jgi:hypothetical protein
MTREDVDGLLGIAIRRISLLDLEKNNREVSRSDTEVTKIFMIVARDPIFASICENMVEYTTDRERLWGNFRTS